MLFPELTLAERLRNVGKKRHGNLMRDSADRIEFLEKEIVRLQEIIEETNNKLKKCLTSN